MNQLCRDSTGVGSTSGAAFGDFFGEAFGDFFGEDFGDFFGEDLGDARGLEALPSFAASLAAACRPGWSTQSAG